MRHSSALSNGCRLVLAICVASPSTVQAAAPCDLSPLTLRQIIAKTIPFASQTIDTRTRVSFVFRQRGDRTVDIVNTNDTFLLLIGEKIAAEIDGFERNLPKNDCRTYARVTNRNAQVNPPYFDIDMNIEASAWLCSKVPPYPCTAMRDSPLNAANPAHLSSERPYSDIGLSVGREEKESETAGMIVPVQFGDFNPFNPERALPAPLRPPSPFNPPPNPFNPSQPIHPPVPVPNVKMCDQLKTKLGGGSVSAHYRLAGTFEGNTEG
jgi:hypothetical protein